MGRSSCMVEWFRRRLHDLQQLLDAALFREKNLLYGVVEQILFAEERSVEELLQLM